MMTHAPEPTMSPANAYTPLHDAAGRDRLGHDATGHQPLEDLGATGTMPPARIRAILADLVPPLSALHRAGRVHGDLALATIGLDAAGRAHLLTPPLQPAANAETATPRDGYAAFEQYTDDPDTPCGPWTDIYGLCAVACALLTGTPPPPALSRCVRDDYVPLVELRPRDEHAFCAVLDAGLSLDAAGRPRTIAEFTHALRLDEAPVAPPAPAAPPEPPEPPAPVAAAAPAPVAAAAPAPAHVRPEPEVATAPLRHAGPPAARPRATWPTVVVVTALAAMAFYAWLRPAPDQQPQTMASASGNSPTPAMPTADQKETAPAVPGQPPPADPATQQPASNQATAGQPSPEQSAAEQAPAVQPQTEQPLAEPPSSGQSPANQATSTDHAAGPLASADPPKVDDASPPHIDAPPASRQPAEPAATPPATAAMSPPGQTGAAPTATPSPAQPARPSATPPATGTTTGTAAAAAPAATPGAAAARPAPKPAMSSVSVAIRPWGEVLVDGRSRGVSPPLNRLMLAPGSYRITVRNRAAPDYHMTLNVVAGRAASIAHSFE
jgi:hypothetical protein